MSRPRCSPILRAPDIFWNSGISLKISLEGFLIASGSRYLAFFPTSFSVWLPNALLIASGSPKYHASNYWHAIRTSASGRRASTHNRVSLRFSKLQSPPSLSRTITKRVSGSRQAASFRGMLFSRSCLPSCGTHINWIPGIKRGRRQSRRAFIERSSRRKTIRFIPSRPRTAPASKARRANRRLRRGLAAVHSRKLGESR